MSVYIFILHIREELPAQRVELEFAQDRDAIEAAENLADLCEVEVWKADCLLAQVTKAKVPSRDASYN